MQNENIRSWCPNCAYFFKEDGQPKCKLLKWENSLRDRSIQEWIRQNSDSDSSLYDDAEGCPEFVYWKDPHG